MSDEADIEDGLSYDEMSYESEDPILTDEIPGVEYGSEIVEETNNDNAEPFEVVDDDISEASSESEADDIRRDIISNISVPESRRKRVMNVESNPLNQVQPGVDAIPDIPNSDIVTSEGRPTRRRNQPTRMNISSNKGNSYDISLVQAICMTQIAEVVKGKRMSLNK